MLSVITSSDGRGRLDCAAACWLWEEGQGGWKDGAPVACPWIQSSGTSVTRYTSSPLGLAERRSCLVTKTLNNCSWPIFWKDGLGILVVGIFNQRRPWGESLESLTLHLAIVLASPTLAMILPVRRRTAEVALNMHDYWAGCVVIAL